MARYSKNNSNFIIRKKHQSINGGTILESDWSTIGERHVIESGKRKVYGDSGFLFTESTRPGLKKRNTSGEWDTPLTLDNLTETVNNSVNIIQLPKSNDLRDYAYWGSAKELLRSTIENIVKWFPGRIWSEDTPIYLPNSDGSGMEAISSIITDGHHNYIIQKIKEENIIIETDEDCITFDDKPKECITFDDKPKECITFSCNTDVIKSDSNIKIWLLQNPFQINLINTNIQFTKYENPLRALAMNWKQYSLNGHDIINYKVWIKPFNECDEDYTILYDISLEYKNNNDKYKGHIFGLKQGKSIIWCTTFRGLDIRPKTKIIEDYFNKLQGFDRVLLTRDSNPLYTANLITPVKITDNYYVYVAKLYQWPSTDYCIDVDNVAFELYINKLYSLSDIIDELWTNNLWVNMTHESIKNFDWTYQNEAEADIIANIEGSNRMEQVLQIMGAHFDDIKRWVDNIKNKNNISYDGNNNLPNAELSDKCNTLGWEVYSTKLESNDNIHLDSASVSNINWYRSINPYQVSQNHIDNEFMRRMALSTKEIFRTKGTKQAIEMTFGMFGIGDTDFEITERYYIVNNLFRKDDIYRFYRQNRDINPDVDNDIYILQSGYKSIQDWMKSKIDENNGNPILSADMLKNYQHIRFGQNNEFGYYDLDDTMTIGQFLAYANERKSIVHNYDDIFSGVPLSIINIDGEDYIAPHFSQDKIYDGDVQFETNGGWGKAIQTFDELHDEEKDIKNQNFNYLETLPYIEIVQNCSQLLTVNPYTIGKKTIFYVMNTSDYVEFNENIPDGLSHYFKLINNINPNLKSSWKTIPMINLDKEEYTALCNSDSAFEGVTYNDYLSATYHDKMIQDNLGNNPHCGYAKYDLGTEYLEYCKQPFKYSIDNYLIADYDILEALKFLTFDIEPVYGEKMINFITNNKQEDKFEYYLPSKLIILKNNINNDQYKDYLNNVILKYVLQVIPSTTILVLENCLKYSEVFTITYNYIDVDGHIIKEPTVLNKNINASLTIQVPDVDCYNYVECKYHDTGVNIDDLYINNITENIIIDIIYKSNKHNVTVIVDPEELSDIVNIEINSDKCGNTGNININNNSTCYRYSGLWLNNMLITDTNPAIFDVSNNPTSNIEYVAKFELKKHTINIIKPNIPITIKYSINDGETNVLTDDIIEVRCGDNIKITTDNKIPGYQFNQWNYRPETNIVPPTNNIIEITSINEDYTIEPTYIEVIEKYTLTIEKPEEVDTCKIGIRTPKNTGYWYVHNITKIFEIEANQSVEVKITPESKIINGYIFNGWQTNNSNVSISNDKTTITIPSMNDNYVIKPIYQYQKYNVYINKPDTDGKEVSIIYKINDNIAIHQPLVTEVTTIEVPAGQVIEIEAQDNVYFGFLQWNITSDDDELNTNTNNNIITIIVTDDCSISMDYIRKKYKVSTTLINSDNTNYQIGQRLAGSTNEWFLSTNGGDYPETQLPAYDSGSDVEIVGYTLPFNGWFEEVNGGWQFLTVKNPYIIQDLSANIKIGGSFGVDDMEPLHVQIHENNQDLNTYNIDGKQLKDNFNYNIDHITPTGENSITYYFIDNEYPGELFYYNYLLSYRKDSGVPLCFKIVAIRPTQNHPTLEYKYKYEDGKGNVSINTVTPPDNGWYMTNGLWQYDLQILTSPINPTQTIIINFITENN